jgi:hypothetical protein
LRKNDSIFPKNEKIVIQNRIRLRQEMASEAQCFHIALAAGQQFHFETGITVTKGLRDNPVVRTALYMIQAVAQTHEETASGSLPVTEVIVSVVLFP